MQLVTDVYNNSYASHRIPNILSELDTEEGMECLSAKDQVSDNIFDNLPCLAKPKPKLLGELDIYLAMDIEDVTDALAWWTKHHVRFPRLSHMAIDYLSIPGEC